MNEKELLKMIEKGESEGVELKKSTAQLEKALKAICGFLNHKGGTVYFGIDENKKIIGQEVSDQTLRSVSQKIRQRIKPEVSPEIKALEIKGKKIIEVKIKEGNNKPYYLDGIAYKRTGTENPAISPDELERLILGKRKRYWDSEICENAKLEDIDGEKVKWYVEKRKKIRRMPEELDVKTLLLNIGGATEIDSKTKPTNAGILFFGKTPQRYIPARIICAKFKGMELSRTTTDNADCTGTLWEMLEQAEDFVRKNIRLFGFRTEFAFRRIDKLEYPIDGIREAIINAIIHRDYYEHSDVRLFIFDDRIEIINSGSFPEGVTPEKPTHKARNPILCQLMRDIGFIEKYGSGIYFMKNLCKEWGIMEPQYEITNIETKIVFKSGGESILISEIEKLGIELNSRQKGALEHFFPKTYLTRSDYMQLNKISHKTAHKELTDLVKKGLLTREGKGRSVRYLIKTR